MIVENYSEEVSIHNKNYDGTDRTIKLRRIVLSANDHSSRNRKTITVIIVNMRHSKNYDYYHYHPLNHIIISYNYIMMTVIQL